MNTDNLVVITEANIHKLSHEQVVMCDRYHREGYSTYIEEYSDYTYAVCVKDGVRCGIIRLNRTGHDVYV